MLTKKSKRIIILIILIVVVIGVVLGIRWYNWNKQLVKENSNLMSEDINISISQINSKNFPEVSMYFNIRNADNKDMNLDNFDFLQVLETNESTKEYDCKTKHIDNFGDDDAININLVVDNSEDMGQNDRLSCTQKALNNFVETSLQRKNTSIELTEFNVDVYDTQPFTNDKFLLQNAIKNSMSAINSRSLWDSIYWALQRSYSKEGSRCVVAVTSGVDTGSIYTEREVIDLSKRAGIPVYIIALDDNFKKDGLVAFTEQCDGGYFTCDKDNLAGSIENLCNQALDELKNCLKVVYESTWLDSKSNYRDAYITCIDDSKYNGKDKMTYMPEPHVVTTDHKRFSDNYILPQSDSRFYTVGELDNLSIWELYMARNEIYARHGKGFRNKDLDEHFSSKSWYLKGSNDEDYEAWANKYLNEFEKANVALIMSIEKAKNSPFVDQHS